MGFIIHLNAKRIKKPTGIIYPTDWFPAKNNQQQHMIDHFLDILANSTGVHVQRLSLESEWSRTGPESVRGMTLSKYLDMVCLTPVYLPRGICANGFPLHQSIFWPNYYDGYHSYDQFRKDHLERYGYKPYTSPFMTKRW